MMPVLFIVFTVKLEVFMSKTSVLPDFHTAYKWQVWLLITILKKCFLLI